MRPAVDDLAEGGVNLFAVIPPSETATTEALRKVAEHVWEKQTTRFPHFTDHGLGHSRRVGKLLNRWLTKREQELQPPEALVLLGAIYLHDIGMQCYDRDMLLQVINVPPSGRHLNLDDIENIFSNNYDEAVLEGIRDRHHILSKMMVQAIPNLFAQHVPGLSCLNGSLLDAIARVSGGHGGTFPGRDLDRQFPLTSAQAVDLRRLCYLLRIGDCLNATRERISRTVFLDNRIGNMRARNEVHIAKHWIVSTVFVGDFFIFQCRVPTTWSGIQQDLVTIAMDPLRKQIERYNTMLLTQGTRVPPEGLPRFQPPSQERDAPWQLRPAVIEAIRQEATKCRVVDAADCAATAQRTLMIAGQNLHTLSDPSRLSEGDLGADHFKSRLFQQMRDRRLQIKILLLDPRKDNEVNFWHNLLVEKNPGRSPDFRADLESAVKVFRCWQEQAIAEGLPLDIRCGDLVTDTANIVDADEKTGTVLYTRTVQDALSDPYERLWIACRYGDFDFEERVRTYQSLFKKATPIQDVPTATRRT